MSIERILSISILRLTVVEIRPSKVWVPRPLFKPVKCLQNLQADFDTSSFSLKEDTGLKIAMPTQYDPVYQRMYLQIAYLDYLWIYLALKTEFVKSRMKSLDILGFQILETLYAFGVIIDFPSYLGTVQCIPKVLGH